MRKEGFTANRLLDLSSNDLLRREILWSGVSPEWLDKYGITKWPVRNVIPLNSLLWDELGRQFDGGPAAVRILVGVWYSPSQEELTDLAWLDIFAVFAQSYRQPLIPSWVKNYQYTRDYLDLQKIASDMVATWGTASWVPGQENLDAMREASADLATHGIDAAKLCRGVMVSESDDSLTPAELAARDDAYGRATAIGYDAGPLCSVIGAVHRLEDERVRREDELASRRLDLAALNGEAFFRPDGRGLDALRPGAGHGVEFLRLNVPRLMAESTASAETFSATYPSSGSVAYRRVSSFGIGWGSPWWLFKTLVKNLHQAKSVVEEYPWPDVTFAGRSVDFFWRAEASGCTVCPPEEAVVPFAFHRLLGCGQELSYNAIKSGITLFYNLLIPKILEIVSHDMKEKEDEAKRKLMKWQIGMAVVSAVLSLTGVGAIIATAIRFAMKAKMAAMMREAASTLGRLAESFGAEDPAFAAESERVKNMLNETAKAFVDAIVKVTNKLGLVVSGKASSEDLQALEVALGVLNGSISTLQAIQAIQGATGIPIQETSNAPSDVESSLAALGELEAAQESGTSAIPVQNLVPSDEGTPTVPAVPLESPEAREALFDEGKKGWLAPAGIGAGGLLAILLLR